MQFVIVGATSRFGQCRVALQAAAGVAREQPDLEQFSCYIAFWNFWQVSGCHLERVPAAQCIEFKICFCWCGPATVHRISEQESALIARFDTVFFQDCARLEQHFGSGLIFCCTWILKAGCFLVDQRVAGHFDDAQDAVRKAGTVTGGGLLKRNIRATARESGQGQQGRVARSSQPEQQDRNDQPEFFHTPIMPKLRESQLLLCPLNFYPVFTVWFV